jgi:glycine cleavage system H protein
VPAGIFVSPNHTWVNIELNGTARVGLDDFARKTIGRIDGVEMPQVGASVTKGEQLFSIQHNGQKIDVASPISGRVTHVNSEHLEHPEWIASKPFELSWMCCIDPSNIPEELHTMKIGAESINWYKEEISKYQTIVKAVERERLQASSGQEQPQDDRLLREFSKAFLARTGTPSF